jgi:hypothetical protein
VQRISHWKIADAATSTRARYNVDFRFRLDVSQLPRPFQIGAVGQADWNISASRNQRLRRESRGERHAPPKAAALAAAGSRALRWAVALAVTVIVAIGIVLLFLLTQATNNRELYERNYGRLFVLNMVVAGLLLA